MRTSELFAIIGLFALLMLGNAKSIPHHGDNFAPAAADSSAASDSSAVAPKEQP